MITLERIISWLIPSAFAVWFLWAMIDDIRRHPIRMWPKQSTVDRYKAMRAGMNGVDVTKNKALPKETMTATQIAEGRRLAKEHVAQKKAIAQ